MALVEAHPGRRRFLDRGLLDVTRPPPGPLCWMAAIGYSGGLLIAAALSAHASGFLVAALLTAMSGLFLLRPLAATLLVLVVHQSVDLWANDQLESIGGLQFNLTTGLVSITGNLVLMSVLVGHFRLPVTPANALTVASCSILTYILSDRLAFQRKANC